MEIVLAPSKAARGEIRPTLWLLYQTAKFLEQPSKLRFTPSPSRRRRRSWFSVAAIVL
jgi:hypothetical protein